MGPFLRLLHVCRGYSLYILILCLFFQIYVRSKYLVTCVYIFRLVSCFINATTTNAIVVALTKYGNISDKKSVFVFLGLSEERYHQYRGIVSLRKG